MKAIILAAGMGNRLGHYTRDLPKAMLTFNGKPLIEWQIQALKRAGLEDIVIVTGYRREKINYSGIRYYHNAEYATTNMVESLLCARPELEGDVLVAYADILYTPHLVQKTLHAAGEVTVAVDEAWREYWLMRYGTTEIDLENLILSEDGTVAELGKAAYSSRNIRYRYIGLIKFSEKGIERVLELYDRKQAAGENWQQSGKPFRQGYMTDLLNELIQDRVEVRPVVTQGGWIEFDTVDDYEKACEMVQTGAINRFIDLDN